MPNIKYTKQKSKRFILPHEYRAKRFGQYLQSRGFRRYLTRYKIRKAKERRERMQAAKETLYKWSYNKKGNIVRIPFHSNKKMMPEIMKYAFN